ncbi:MAG: cytochrome c-type biogenesis protein CcmH [Gaiellaceae bacterium]
MRALLFLAVLVSLIAAGGAAASEERPTLADLEDEVVCPVCTPETLEQSNSAVADRMRAFIRQRIAAGDTKSEIKEKLVAQFGEQVLAAPPKSGFNVLAWALPLTGGLLAGVAVGALALRWSRVGEPAPLEASSNGRAPLDPELERRVDEELARFDA